MIKTHTAQSLAKYLGGKVLFKKKECFLEGINIQTGYCFLSELWTRHPRSACYLDRNIFPILKPYEKLLEPMIHEGKQIIPIKYIYLQLYYTVSKECWESIRISDSGIWSIDGCLVAPDFQMLITMVSSTPQIIERLIELGFGAIKDESSPTGYRDLFGYVCEVER